MPGEEANESKAQKLAAARKKVKTLIMTRHSDKSLECFFAVRAYKCVFVLCFGGLGCCFY